MAASSGEASNGAHDEEVDPWGFYVASMPWWSKPASQRLVEAQEALDAARDRKWAAMTRPLKAAPAGPSKLVDLSAFAKSSASKRTKLKERIRKGVPRAWRRLVWPALLEVELKKRATNTPLDGPRTPRGAAAFRAESLRDGVTYSSLCRRTAGDAPRDSAMEVIERDLCRTYPRHRLFDSKVADGGGSESRESEARGVSSLRRVLRAYASLDPETEYCQGMNYVAALLIIHVCALEDDDADASLRRPPPPPPPPQASPSPPRDTEDDKTSNHRRRVFKGGGDDLALDPHGQRGLDGSAEEEAFWLFVAALRAPRTRLRDLYRPGMVGARRALFVYDKLFETNFAALHSHLANLGVIPDMYATHWIVTVFAAQFPFALVSRVWDMFFAEGWKPVYRVAVAIVGAYRDELLGCTDFEQALVFLRNLPEQIDVDKVLDKAHRLRLTTIKVDQLDHAFHLLPDDEE